MKKVIIPCLSLVALISFASGFALSRSSQQVRLKMNKKDLPQHGLRLLGPSDPAFEEKLTSEFKGETNELLDTLKPFSVFLENRGERPVVGYLIQWCFTTTDGHNQYYRKALVDPQALMDVLDLSPELKRQQGWIEPGSATFLSLLKTDGSGFVRSDASAKEAAEFRKGKMPDETSRLARFRNEAAKFAQITVSIDGAFFEDGTFVGPDTSNFFAQTKAMIDARRDLLDEIAAGLSTSGTTTDSLYERLKETAAQSSVEIDSASTPADYYHYFKKFYANDILKTKEIHGQNKALEIAIRPRNKSWATLGKKED